MDTKALRQKILDLAIRGKLVPQDPNDEPASVLLERIREQKKQMVKEGKLKAKDIKNDSVIFVGEDSLHYEKFADGSVKCIEDEIPFELPDGWAWARIFSITEDLPYGTVKKSMQTGLVAVLRMGNIQSGEIDYSDLVYSSDIDDIKKYTLVKNDLLFNRTNSAEWVGKTAIYRGNMPAIYAGYLIRVRAFIDSEYLNVVMNSSYAKAYCNSVKTDGVNQSNINAQKLGNFLVPIPSLVEQKRISSSIVEFIPRISMIQEEKEHIADLVLQTKSKILDLAIRGQLVPQNSDDEPASVLLERIRAEKEELIKQGKIKRDKKESVIFKGEDNSYYEKFFDGKSRCINNEIPFDLPDGWEYERLGNICTVARGGSPRPIEAFLTNDDNGLNWIKIGDTEQGGKYIYCTKEKIRPDGLTKTRYVKSGDFLLTNSMSFGRPYILKTEGCIHDGWLVIGNTEDAFEQDYLYYLLSSSTMYNSLSSLAVGSTVKNLKLDSVKSLLVPIPPLKEQQVIANQIELLFNTILPIEKSLS
ncbi:restriction endonuclease subunit S [Clostridium sp.]|uniref:restriction endonuclease subunit S n=1 Tax=Clostridium sp. TaxID=1506 RepID=UPI00258CCAD4|nr:restriction endonuclease subunit S [Clostridium sp.]MCI6139754.1 restriction endonuclease subunit S [Clostridium sp.]